MNKTSVAQQPKTTSFLPPVPGLLQRKCACGNHTVAGGECAACAKNKSGLQRKLSIGASNDPLEREADRVADQVMAAPINSTSSRAPLHIQRYAGQVAEGSDTAPASVDRVLASSGRPLESSLRQDMEHRFGHDFSQVRLHSGGDAELSAREVNANGYTVGHNVVFGAGRFAPETDEGRRLLAHELTHVVQQTGADRSWDNNSNENHGLSPTAQQSRGGALALSNLLGSSFGQAASNLNQASSPIKVSRSAAPVLARQKATEATKPQPSISVTKTLQSGRTLVAVNNVAIAESNILPGEIEVSYRWTPENLDIVIVFPEGKEVFPIPGLNTNTALLKLSSHFTLSLREKLKEPRSDKPEVESGSLKGYRTVETITGQRLKPVPAKKAPIPPQAPPQVIPPPVVTQPENKTPINPAPDFQFSTPPPIDLNLPSVSKYGKPKTEKEIGQERIDKIIRDALAGRSDIPPLPKGLEPKSLVEMIKQGVKEGVKPLIKNLPKNAREFILEKLDSAVEEGVSGIADAALDSAKLDGDTKAAIKKAIEAGIKLKPGQAKPEQK